MEVLTPFSIIQPFNGWDPFTITEKAYTKELPYHLQQIAESFFLREDYLPFLKNQVIPVTLALLYALPIINIITYVVLRSFASFTVLSQDDLIELQNWVNDIACSPGENREEAQRKIIECAVNRAVSLDLRLLGLTSLPSCLSKLNFVKNLDLSFNRLSTVPKVSDVEQLNLSWNKLTTIPDHLRYFKHLQWLNINRNELKLFQSVLLDLPKDCKIFLHHNLFPKDTATRFNKEKNIEISDPPKRSVVYEPNFHRAIKGLTDLLPCDISSKAIEGQFTQLRTEFLGLMNKIEFHNIPLDQKKELAAFLLNSLDLVSVDEEFSETFKNLVVEASTNCHDRAFLFINRIYLAYCIKTRNFANKKISDFFLGAERLRLLDERALSFIKKYNQGKSGDNQHGEEVEVFLTYQTHLEKALSLPIVCKTMLFSYFSKVGYLDLIFARYIILTKTLNKKEALLQSPIWRDYITRKYPQKYDELLGEINLEAEEGECSDSFCRRLNNAYAKALSQLTDLFFKEESHSALM